MSNVWVSVKIILFILAGQVALAKSPPIYTTFQTRILTPAGLPLEAGHVNFRFTILDAVGTCALYVEDFNSVSMAGTGGVVSFSLGSGAKQYPPTATAMYEVFNNSTASFPCQAGGTINPTTTQNRQIVMQFNDGSGWQTLPQMGINAVPYANYANRAEFLGDYEADKYLRPANLPACTPGTEAINWDGTSFTCVASSASSGGTVTSVSGTTPLTVTGGTSTPVISIPAATSAVSGYLSSTDWTTFNNKASATLGSGLLYLGSGGNTATGVALSGDATLANTGVMTLVNSGVAANTYGSASLVPILAIDAKGRVTSASSSAYQNATGAAKGVVQVGSNITVNSGTISVTSSDITNALGYTPTASTLGFVNGGNAFSADATLGTTDNYNLSLKTNNTSRLTIDTAGNVGIGTTTPASSLTVATGQILGSDGTSANPTFSFVSDPDTGFKSAGTNAIGFVTGGTTAFYINAGGIRFPSGRNFADSTTGNPFLQYTNTNAVWNSPTNYFEIENGASGLQPVFKASGADANIDLNFKPKGAGNSVFTSGNVGIGTTAPVAKLEIQGAAVSRTNTVASGATVDLALSNVHHLKSVGDTTIILQNPVSGGSYTIVVSDLTSRTYTFSGCTHTYFNPANGATSGRSTYSILTIDDGTDTECYIAWMTGFN